MVYIRSSPSEKQPVFINWKQFVLKDNSKLECFGTHEQETLRPACKLVPRFASLRVLQRIAISVQPRIGKLLWCALKGFVMVSCQDSHKKKRTKDLASYMSSSDELEVGNTSSWRSLPTQASLWFKFHISCNMIFPLMDLTQISVYLSKAVTCQNPNDPKCRYQHIY